MWPFIDGHYLGKGVDISHLPAERFTSILETYWVEDQIRHIDPSLQQEQKEKLRVEFIKYNRRSNYFGSADEDNDTTQPPMYLDEPTSDGYLPGLADGYLGEA